jgi:ATP-dependent exoDNAse (exonuclease V) alpha subunit
VTIHKSQGQTLSRVGLIIETDAFAHGLIYVALSRVSSWNDLFFFSPEGRNTIHNKVIKALLPQAQLHNYQRDHHRAFDAQHHQ